MRLTLRTLLAYLDDVLEPAQTKLIGQKIQESDVAGKLVSLIRLVVRQRRLKAPSISGPNVGIDPNVVAQYLDNTLNPESVVEVEKVLLTSDELLAEVASCHQVMALMMGKTAEVSETSREKLYALGPVDEANQLHVDEPRRIDGKESSGSNGRIPERPADTVAPKPASHEIPDYLRPNPWSKRVFPAMIVVVLIAVCVGLLVSDPKLLSAIRQNKDVASTDPAKNPGAVENGAKNNGENVADATSPDMATNDQTVAATTTPPATPAVTQTPPATTKPPVNSIDPPPPPDKPDDPADAVVAANRTKPPATVAVPENTAPANTPADPLVPNRDPKPLLNPLAVQYISNDGVVMRLDDAQNHWFLLPRRSAVAPGELIAVLEPFEAVLDIDRGGLIATVMGDTTVRLIPPDRSVASGLDIRRGRIQFRTSRKDASQTPVIAIGIGNDAWKLEFLSAETVCTIEVAPREPIGFEKPPGPIWYVGVLRVLSGSVKWTSADGKSQQVNGESALEVSPQLADAPRPSPVSTSFAPDWTDAAKRKQSPLRRFAALFEKQFELDQPVETSLQALIKDSNAKIVELAVHGLSLTESHSALVQALAECPFEEGRFAARDGLRIWLAREAERGPMLKQLLEQHYPVPEANAVYLLLWGFKPEDASNRAISLELVNFLRSSHVEIREMAYYWIVNLTGRKWEFRAADVPARRESAVRKLETHVMQTGALVKPTEKETAK
jgi:hypothetical protein